MNTMLKVYLTVVNYFASEEGQGMAEYGLILALIAVAVIAAAGLLGDEIATLFGTVKENLVASPG